jgi:pyruvate/2-oxoglutarate dehydrogenase complex dihydrolipoamide acyltransferase (E2) component
MRVRPIRSFAVAVAVAAAAAAGPSGPSAQVVIGAAGSAVVTVRPIPTPTPLRLGAVPRFDFAAEVTNSGVPLPGLGDYIVVEGTGSVAPLGKTVIWRFEFLKVTIDTAVVRGSGPLAVLTVETDTANPDGSSFALGFAPPHELPPRSPAHRVLDTATRTLIAALADPSGPPLAVGSPLVDVSAGVRRYLKRFLQPVEMTDPIAPLVVEGLSLHQGRVGIVARALDQFQLRYGPQPVALNAEALMMFDRPTALPLLADFRVTGTVQAPSVSGPVDVRVKAFLSVTGMRSPNEMLRGVPQPRGATPAAAPAPSQPRTGPAPAQPQAAPQTAPARRAAPPPAAAPPAAAPAQQSAPGAQPAERQQLIQRLEMLKELYQRNLITKEQYEQQQQEILNRL